jgi:hypothetical protein
MQNASEEAAILEQEALNIANLVSAPSLCTPLPCGEEAC